MKYRHKMFVALLLCFNRAIIDALLATKGFKARQSTTLDSVRNKRATLPYMKTSEASNNPHIDAEDLDKDAQGVNDAHKLSQAEKQIMDPDYDYYAKSKLPSWRDDYATSSRDSSQAYTKTEAIYAHSGGARQARVNFITQPRKPDVGVGVDMPRDFIGGPQWKSATSTGYYDSAYDPKQLPMAYGNYDAYPSRSYEPYLRRYDRYDEQYARTHPLGQQYYEDMHLYRQRFDPYDSYSPRMPQYPEPYSHYPDRYLDVPQARDYHDYRNDDSIHYKGTSHTPNLYRSTSQYTPYPSNHGRVIYYAHLPEIVRTPYDILRFQNRDRVPAAAGGDKKLAYKLNSNKDNAMGGLGYVNANAEKDDLYFNKRNENDRPSVKLKKTNLSTSN